MRFRLILTGAAALALGACQHDGKSNLLSTGPDNFGEANRQTMMAQVLDPDPVYDTAVPETYAQHAGQAIERYRSDRVKKPDKVTTSTLATGGGGSGGGGK